MYKSVRHTHTYTQTDTHTHTHTHTYTQTDTHTHTHTHTHTVSYLKCLQPAIFHILQQPVHLSQTHSMSGTMHKHQMHQLQQCIGWNSQAPICNWNTQQTYISTSSTQSAKHQRSFRMWFCSPWTRQTVFHNFCTSSDDRSLCVCNKNWTKEQIKNHNNIQQYKYLHTITVKILTHIPHFTKKIAQCPQVTIIKASPPLTDL
jgi:hypothetical protein